ARSAIKALTEQGRELHIVPQNLVELWVVATRPVELGMSPPAVAAELARLKSMFLLLPETPTIFPVWRPSSQSIRFRQARLRSPPGRGNAGAWPHRHLYFRQNRIFPIS